MVVTSRVDETCGRRSAAILRTTLSVVSPYFSLCRSVLAGGPEKNFSPGPETALGGPAPRRVIFCLVLCEILPPLSYKIIFPLIAVVNVCGRKEINVLGKDVLNAEIFQYVQTNVYGYSSAAYAGSIKYKNTV